MSDKHLYVLATFDGALTEQIKNIGSALDAQGLTGQQTPGLPPHITLGQFPCTDEALLRQRLSDLIGITPKVALTFHALGLFGLRVLFLAPDPSYELLALRRTLCPGGGDWTPHATLLIAGAETIQRAIPVAAGFNSFEGLHGAVECLSLWEFFPARHIADYRLSGGWA